jgi:dihydroorotase
MLERDLRLVRLTGARYHAAMISCEESVRLIEQAKKDGLSVSCGVSINHLTLNENDIGDYRTFLKLNPPLRHEDERVVLVDALARGVIDVIVSDHDPQDVEVKRQPFAEAAPGAIGLETMLAAARRRRACRPHLVRSRRAFCARCGNTSFEMPQYAVRGCKAARPGTRHDCRR